MSSQGLPAPGPKKLKNRVGKESKKSKTELKFPLFDSFPTLFLTFWTPGPEGPGNSFSTLLPTLGPKGPRTPLRGLKGRKPSSELLIICSCPLFSVRLDFKGDFSLIQSSAHMMKSSHCLPKPKPHWKPKAKSNNIMVTVLVTKGTKRYFLKWWSLPHQKLRNLETGPNLKLPSWIVGLVLIPLKFCLLVKPSRSEIRQEYGKLELSPHPGWAPTTRSEQEKETRKGSCADHFPICLCFLFCWALSRVGDSLSCFSSLFF